MGQLNIDSERPPIFIGAGTAKDEAGIAQLVGTEAAAIIIGSYTEPAWAGNDQGGTKRVEYWDEIAQAYYNSIGLKNPGRLRASEYLPRCIRQLRDAGQLAIISVTTLKGEDPNRVLPGLVEWALEMGADAVEINGSCPNQDPKHPLLCNDVAATRQVIASIRERVGSGPYLIYKVSALPPDVIQSYCGDDALAVDAVDTINTLGNQQSPINPATGTPYIEVNDGLAGKSGPSILDLSRTNLTMWLSASETESAENGKQFDVLSIGGVDNGREVHLRHTLGRGALLVGGVQAFRRAADARQVVHSWANEYTAAQAKEQT